MKHGLRTFLKEDYADSSGLIGNTCYLLGLGFLCLKSSRATKGSQQQPKSDQAKDILVTGLNLSPTLPPFSNSICSN